MYKVDYSNVYGAFKEMEVGTHTVRIKEWRYFEPNVVNDIEYTNIGLLIENDTGATKWDTIYENLVEENGQAYLVYDPKKLNTISVAVRLPNGTNFQSINEWLDALVGKPYLIDIEKHEAKNGKEYTRIVNTRPLETPKKPVNQNSGLPWE